MHKKIKEPLNVTIVWPYVILVMPNVTMEPTNVTKKKVNIKCDYNTVIWDVGIVKCDFGTT